MKTSIKLSALFVLLTAGVFATTTAKAFVDPNDVTPKAKEVVSFKALDHDRGLTVNFAKSESGKSMVKVYNKDNELLLKDIVPSKTDVSKGYVLTGLADGEYTMEIYTNNQVVKKSIHVYQDGDQKSFYIAQ
ncbi:hypothetical protein J3L18_17100 [Mucilaginibacter gossypii]|uniref:hypothetical protein n=1 Tax=Mucilaginibacter gossypii TaxID=551996 RepID=UPI000DCB569F|nr:MULTISPECIES: hypothetical protein [Mucilaginibacter]QTE34868.1 hypothetical protein J3L18_17100 [Mucilaginibacter gossypii]RAV59618.1 hypothetical protein DIU36_05175 [Mucilaginibacter rubeus]